MNLILIVILAIHVYPCYVTKAYTGNAVLGAARQIDGQRNPDTSDGPVNDVISTQWSAGIDNVTCTTLDEVTAARKSLCPAQCSCSPLDGQEAWTKLIVDCSGTQSNVTEDLVQLLSTCTSELLELTVTNTPLTTVPEVVCRLSKIQSLNLNNNLLASLPSNCFTQMRNLTSFRANNNRLTLIQEGVFTNLHQLKLLNLISNLISFIEPFVFDESANLSLLSSIDLSHNRMTELEPWPLKRAQHRSMNVVLRHNSITNFTNALQWSYNCNSTKIFESTLDLHENDIKHIIDAVNGWSIDGIYGLLCLGNTRSSYPLLSLDVSSNPFNCDCKDFEIISFARLFARTHRLDRANCETPPDLYDWKLINVPLDRLVCDVTELCPPGCSCIKRPSSHSFEVFCPPATLSSLPYHLPNPNEPPPRQGKFDLSFGGNSMKFLESRDYFANTSRVDVSNSKIDTVTDETWRSLQRVDRVDLSGNRLTTLPRLLQTENIMFQWISLRDNPLSCECEQRWLSTWLKSLGSALHQPDSVKCHSPDWLKHRSIVSLQNDDYCRNPDRERVLYVLKIVVPTVAGAILLVSACFVILYRCRVKVFAKFNVHPFDVDECENENMAFDAFVSCAWPDDDLAQEIVNHLEGGNVEEGDRGGYRVCYHSRDFPLGGVILRSIQQSIEHSKRVICLLSGAFLSSEFCMLEFRTAWQWNLEHQRHRLIVVKCPGVDEALAAAERDAVPGVEDVRMFLSTYTYIEHGSDDWWQKLLYAMPINRLPTVDFDFHQRFFDGADNDDREALLVNV